MPTHRTPVAYKRPLAATTPRQMIGTSSVVYSPRATPPAKIMAGQGQQRVVTKMVSSIQTNDSSDLGDDLPNVPLTPPPTPDVVAAL